MKPSCLLLACMTLTASGCAATYAFVPREVPTLAPRPADCSFEVLSVPPSQKFEELGVLRPNHPFYGAEDFRRDVQPKVCAAGGNAVIVQIGPHEHYGEATVIRIEAASR